MGAAKLWVICGRHRCGWKECFFAGKGKGLTELYGILGVWKGTPTVTSRTKYGIVGTATI